MATKVDFMLSFQTALASITETAGAEKLLPDIAQDSVNEARQLGPYNTGHNAASIFWAAGNGALRNRERRKNKKAAWATSAGSEAVKGAIIIGTSSGYGGILELNPRGAVFTHKATPDANAPTKGSHFIRRGLARTLAAVGGMRTKAAATRILIEAEAKMTPLKRIL